MNTYQNFKLLFLILKAKWPFPLTEAPIPLQNGKLTKVYSYSCVFVFRWSKDLGS